MFQKEALCMECGVVVPKLSSGHCANAGLVVVALMCTCKFVTCSVCEYVHFVRCMGAPATDHDNLYSHRG